MKIIYKKDTISVITLEGSELDKWVSRAMGEEVVGKALAYYDPESGSITLDLEQKEYKGTFMSTHMHYMHVNCNCELYNKLDQEMVDLYHDSEILETIEKEKVLGHNVFCLQPVLEYSTNENLLSYLMTKYKLGITPLVINETETLWICHVNIKETKSGKYHLLKGKTPSEAVCRAIVYSKYGEEVPGD